MAKTIQVRVEDDMKTRADALFASLGMDTSTAIRVFLTAAIEIKGIPFAVAHRYNVTTDPILEDDYHTLRKSIASVESGKRGLSVEECDASWKAAIAGGTAANG
ncbi:MAG: type II toxin-antitoxin system RelB/DinJ family antitoxin [Synergistaceae bacterium]|jgi:DNA-damage-inducible protein J|nr:type II toxin-antitoxin system RelB/DinJ family antitoxin [Synergistaceae bacterium]